MAKTAAQLETEIQDAFDLAGSALLLGSGVLWKLSLSTMAARAHKLSKWSDADKTALKAVLDYVRRSYKIPGAIFPRLVPYGMGGAPAITCGNHQVANFSTYDRVQAAESIARQAAEACGLAMR